MTDEENGKLTDEEKVKILEWCGFTIQETKYKLLGTHKDFFNGGIKLADWQEGGWLFPDKIFAGRLNQIQFDEGFIFHYIVPKLFHKYDFTLYTDDEFYFVKIHKKFKNEHIIATSIGTQDLMKAFGKAILMLMEVEKINAYKRTKIERNTVERRSV